MKINDFLIIGCLLVSACKEYPDPLVTTEESIAFQYNGYNQKSFAGSYLNDSIVVYARNIFGYQAIGGLTVQFKVIKGDGETDDEAMLTNQYGKAATRWKLGESGNDQQMEASLFNSNAKKFTMLRFQAYGFKSDTWDATMASPEIGITDMAADTVNGITFALTNNGPFMRGERYFDWNPLTSFPYGLPRTIAMGNDLTFYFSTWDGLVYKSIDHGLNWLACARPWADYFSFLDMRTSAGNFLWATAPGRPLRCSHDGGNSWITDSLGLPTTERLGDIFRLTDGTFFLLSLNGNLYKSGDDGHSWTKMNSPQYALKLYVTGNDELILLNQENGISIYKSSDKGNHFTLKYAVQPALYTMMDHTVHKRGTDYYLLIPGFGILHTTDFETFDNYWINSALYDLYMDHDGVFLARGQYGDPVYYRHNSVK